ncbi:MAG TPA: hypothetical protein V6D34_01445 [Candidatus Sericytochromatia bacterium]
MIASGRVGTVSLYFHTLATIAQASDTKSFKSAKRSDGAGKTTIALWRGPIS